MQTCCDRHLFGISADASKGANLTRAGFGRAAGLVVRCLHVLALAVRLETSHPFLNQCLFCHDQPCASQGPRGRAGFGHAVSSILGAVPAVSPLVGQLFVPACWLRPRAHFYNPRRLWPRRDNFLCQRVGFGHAPSFIASAGFGLAGEACFIL